MFESLAFALVKTFIVFAFQTSLEDAHAGKLQGMPKWYGQAVERQVCESGMATEAMPEALDKAVADGNARLVRRLQLAMDSAAEARVRKDSDAAERSLIQAFGHDDNLPRFVELNAVRRNQQYRNDAPKAAYVRMCIDGAQLEKYQRARLDDLSRSVSLYRRDRADKDLDEQLNADDDASRASSKESR